MTRLKKKSNLLTVIVIFLSFFVVPVIGIQLKYSNAYDQVQKQPIKLGFLPSSLSSQTNMDTIDFESQSEYKISKFDSELNEFLTSRTSFQGENPEFIKIIILFEDSASKENRVEILDSIFDDYEIIYNYDIIPGIYLKIYPNQLITYGSVIDAVESIKKIYKSKLYQNPYILENNLDISALSSEDYSNWWLSAVGAENLNFDGSGVKVAVIDTGIYDHPDLDIINNSNFVTDESANNFDDDVGHGTHVGGIIAGDGSGSSGEYRGVAPGVLLINARALNASGGSEGDIVKAIEWSSKPIGQGGAGADIVSMSIGGGYPIISDLITQAISYAKDEYGVIFVASAGNSGPEYFTGSTPASGIDVIAVGATNKNDELVSFSSWGPTFGYLGYPDVVAPGINIISTEAADSILSDEQRYIGDFFDYVGDGDYIPLSGTSMSCPVVAGALAILLDAYPNITPETARIALLEGARKLTDENDDDLLKSGAGIVNVSASLNYLDYLNNTSPNINDIAKLYPDDLPVKPYDLLQFPGDRQKFNLTIISGKNNNYSIDLPSNIQGLLISLDNSSIDFSEAGVKFLELGIEISKNAFPGIRNFQFNLSVGGQIYDIATITLDIKLPEYRILMESYHGLNDWFPNISRYKDVKFSQVGFYDAMADLSKMNISIDYFMEHWTPDYNKDLNNSILTEERLAQYDVVVLQAPMLPYSPLEIFNLKNYFENGGNLFFLGTRYQDLVVDNINYLFSELGVDIQINEENIVNDNWLGIGTSVSSQTIHDFNNPELFNGVNDVFWQYGNTFTVSSNAESIATIDNKAVVALYNGTSQGKGHVLAFGDLNWLYYKYKSSNYTQDHFNLLTNIMDFILPQEDVSINIDLKQERISNSKIDFYVYLKNQTSQFPITISDYDSLDVIISNQSFSMPFILNDSLSDNGIYFNDSFNLPYPDFSPYLIGVNLTIDSQIYSKTTKILYFNQSEVPKINSLSADDTSITRAPSGPGNSINLIAEMDKPTYGIIQGYLSIYSYSFYNTQKSVNKTLTFTSPGSNTYTENFDPDTTDPSGSGIYYIVPTSSNYTNPNSPRYVFEIVNHPPEILDTSSYFNFGGYSEIYFDETETDEVSYLYSATQGDTFNFGVDVRDTVFYEDDNSNMRVFVNLFICSVTDDGFVIFIFPQSIEVSELIFQPISDQYEGTFTIPSIMLYDSISGINPVSTAVDINLDTNEGYIALLYITLYDSEGGDDEFAIILLISEPPIDFSFLIIIVISIVALLAFVSLIVYYARRKRYPRVSPVRPRYQKYEYRPYYEETEEEAYITPEVLPQVGPSMYCPFCGQFVSVPKKFCPHCGESLEFLQQDEENNN